MEYTPERLTTLPGSNYVFVFGSNLAGSHGAGAAKDAVTKFGAVYGIGVGHVGQSFAIPTKDFRGLHGSKNVLSLQHIKVYVDLFESYATHHPEYIFIVTKIGCGLAGYSSEDIAPLFRVTYLKAPNCIWPEDWVKIFNEN